MGKELSMLLLLNLLEVLGEGILASLVIVQSIAVIITIMVK